MFLRKGSSRKTGQIQTPDRQAHKSDNGFSPCLSKQDTPGHAKPATSTQQGYVTLFPHATSCLATLIHSFTMPLAYHTGSCFPNWENQKDCVKRLYHSHHKLIHFKALILIFETSLELWLGFQGKTPFFFNAHRSCYKQRVTAWKTFRLAEGKSTTFSVVSRQLTHWGKSKQVTQNLPNYSSKELPKSYYKNIFLAVAS